MWVYYNPNPCGRNAGDCTVRAISKALNQDWGTTYAGLTAYGFIRSDMPSGDYSNKGTRGKHYVRGHYSRGEDDDSYSRYMNNKSSYRSAKSPNEKKSMVTALEEHLSDLTEELEGMNRDADCIEERAAISKFIQRLENML